MRTIKAAQSQPIRATAIRHGSRLIAGSAFIESLNWYEMPNRRITTCFIGLHDVWRSGAIKILGNDDKSVKVRKRTMPSDKISTTGFKVVFTGSNGSCGTLDTSLKNPTFCDNSRGIGHSEWEGPEKSAKEEFQVVNVFGYCQLFVKIAWEEIPNVYGLQHMVFGLNPLFKIRV